MTETDQPTGETSHALGTLPRSALYVVLAVLVACLGACIVYLFFTDSKTDPPRYYIALGLLFFALCTAGNLIFANTKAFLELKTGLLVATMAGPAVLWFVALVVFSQFIAKDGFFPTEERLPMKFESLPVELAAYERELGWYAFDDWSRRNPGLQKLFVDAHESDIAGSLWKIAQRSIPETSHALSRAEVNSLWLYSSKHGVVKLQRITGHKSVQGSDAMVRIPFRASPSTAIEGDGPATISVMFQGRRDHGALEYLRAHIQAGGYVAVEDEHVDSLIVTWYRDFLTTDYLFVDTRPYACDDHSQHRIGVVALDRKVMDARLWSGRLSRVPQPPLPPTSFARIRANDRKDSIELADWLGPWAPMFRREVLTNGSGTAVRDQVDALFTKLKPFGDLTKAAGKETPHTWWFVVDDARGILTMLVSLSTATP